MLPTGLEVRYRLVRALGQGGFGAVVEAEDRETGRRVALKLLKVQDAEGVERFRREARTLARVKHPGVVEVLDFGVVETTPYLVMELVEGGPLAPGRWPPEAARACLADVAAALDALHAEGVVHRDVKAENLVRRPDGGLVLVDFGLARATQRGATVTQEGLLIGTPSAMAPELWRGEAATPASDQFALAALACRLVADAGPYPEGSPAEIAREALAGRAAVPPGVPSGWHEALARALAADPGARHPSCAALVGSLGAAGQVPGTAATQVLAVAPVAAGETTRRTRPGSRGWGALVAAGLVAVGLGWWSSRTGAPPTPEPSAAAVAPPVAAPTQVAPQVRAEAAQRIHDAWSRVGEELGLEPGEDISGRVFRGMLIANDAIVTRLGQVVDAQAAWLALDPGSPDPLPRMQEVWALLNLVSDAGRLLQVPHAALALSPEELRFLPERVLAAKEHGEDAFGALLTRPDLAPAHRLEVASMLLLTGYADPEDLLQHLEAAGWARPWSPALSTALGYAVASFGEFAYLSSTPCGLRRRMLVWAFEALMDPARGRAYPADPNWVVAWYELLTGAVAVANDPDCAGQAPSLGPVLAEAVARYRVLRREATGATAEALASDDPRIADLAQSLTLPPELAEGLQALEAMLPPSLSRERRASPLQRVLDLRPKKP